MSVTPTDTLAGSFGLLSLLSEIELIGHQQAILLTPLLSSSGYNTGQRALIL